MKWFRKAADQGSALAQNNIGWLYQNGWGTPQDYAEAANWYRKAAEQGNATAQCNLGWLYRRGLGVKQDYSEAMAWFRKGAQQGDSKSEVNIGWLYERGLGISRDYVEAASWYRKAADRGDTDAQTYLGELYQYGRGVRQDYAEAMTWYLQAAGKGNAEAECNIGWLYEKGLGVKQDPVEAMAWYYRAAGRGNAQAQNNIGWLYENGLGVKPDDSEATNWYRKAAAQDNVQAKANLRRLSPGTIDVKQAEGSTVADASPVPAPDKGNAPAVTLPNGIRAPRVIYAPDPEYSAEARKENATGEVMLQLVVGDDGQPRDIKVVASLGKGLDEKAIDAVKTWKFEPATKDGTPVAVQLMIEVEFRLDETGVGKVEVVTDSQGINVGSYLSPAIRQVGDCWGKTTDNKANAPSVKQGQATIQFAIRKDRQVSGVEIISSSGDDALDRDASNCASSLKMADAFPPGLKGKELVVRMQLLYKLGGASLTPNHAQLVAGGRKQFHIQMAGIADQAADWSVTGIGCTGPACGTVSADGLYTAPEVLPEPPFVRVQGTLAGANPVAAYAIVSLVK